MTVEDQVTSLELSGRLEELGVKQHSFFVWARVVQEESIDWIVTTRHQWEASASIVKTSWPAFTVAELGEMLPDYMSVYRIHGKYVVDERYRDKSETALEGHYSEAETMADACAKMIIYLKENNLI